jgi:hypothetical protein
MRRTVPECVTVCQPALWSRANRPVSSVNAAVAHCGTTPFTEHGELLAAGQAGDLGHPARGQTHHPLDERGREDRPPFAPVMVGSGAGRPRTRSQRATAGRTGPIRSGMRRAEVQPVRWPAPPRRPRCVPPTVGASLARGVGSSAIASSRFGPFPRRAARSRATSGVTLPDMPSRAAGWGAGSAQLPRARHRVQRLPHRARPSGRPAPVRAVALRRGRREQRHRGRRTGRAGRGGAGRRRRMLAESGRSPRSRGGQGRR